MKKNYSIWSASGYPTTLGYEHARIPANMSITKELMDVVMRASKFIDETFIETDTYKKLVADSEGGKYECGALEFASSIIKKPEDLTTFYKYVESLFKTAGRVAKCKFVANTETPTHYVEGGGGHIHLGCDTGCGSNHAVRLANKIIVFLLNNPTIPWFMSEWCDDDVCVSTFYHSILKYFGAGEIPLTTNMIWAHLDHQSSGWGMGPAQSRLQGAIKNPMPTVEIRCFQSPTSLENLHDNADMAMKIFMHAQYHSTPPLRFSSVKEMKKFYKTHDPIKEFNLVLATLGLERKRYSKYLANYRRRLRDGTLFPTNSDEDDDY
jgi:hypothetical protein